MFPVQATLACWVGVSGLAISWNLRVPCPQLRAICSPPCVRTFAQATGT